MEHTLPVRIPVQLANGRGFDKPGKSCLGPKREDARTEFPTLELQKMFVNLVVPLTVPKGQYLPQNL